MYKDVGEGRQRGGGGEVRQGRGQGGGRRAGPGRAGSTRSDTTRLTRAAGVHISQPFGTLRTTSTVIFRPPGYVYHGGVQVLRLWS